VAINTNKLIMRFLFLGILILIVSITSAQSFEPFKTLRYDEDYSNLKSDTNRSGYRKVKYHPISTNGNTYLSTGGEIRYQYFFIKNEDWGDAAKDKDGFLFSRFLVHTDLHSGNNFRLFLQLQGSMANGKASGTSAVDENPLDLHQAFVDVSNHSKNATIRLGRQEFSYGSQRLISVRELPNNRQAFDAAKAIFLFPKANLDVFYSRYVGAKKGFFDDVSDRGVNFWGAYFTKRNIPILKNADLYYLGLSKENAAFNDSAGKERRHSFGSRIWSNGKSWKYDFEGVYQFGNFTGKKISAWTLSSNVSYKFSGTRYQPEFGIKMEIISGDQQKGDDELGTFNPLFPKGAYFGLAALIGPANLMDVHPSLGLELIKGKLTWTTDYDIFWRHSINDGLYTPNVSLIYPSGNSTNRFIGKQLATDFSFNPNRFLLIRVEATWFDTGPYLKDVSSGHDIFFIGITSQLKF
jgi:hypothetical protein